METLQQLPSIGVPSPAKKSRLSEEGGEGDPQQPPDPLAATVHSEKGPRIARPQKCADFSVSHLEDFYKANPPFRQPVEIGSFSFDGQGRQQLDRSGLRWYAPAGRSGMDLKVGYAQYEAKLNQTPDLTHLLTWLSHNWKCFLPKLRGQGSIEGEHNFTESNSTGGVPSASSSSSISSASANTAEDAAEK